MISRNNFLEVSYFLFHWDSVFIIMSVLFYLAWIEAHLVNDGLKNIVFFSLKILELRQLRMVSYFPFTAIFRLCNIP